MEGMVECDGGDGGGRWRGQRSVMKGTVECDGGDGGV